MSSVDLVILGILLEKPQSAYELQKDVVNHHYDKWSKIGITTIYQNVHRLQAAGYLQSEMQPGEKRTNRAVYSITEAGKVYFTKLMHEIVDREVAFLFDFNIVITNMNKIAKTEADVLFHKLHNNIKNAALKNAALATKYADIPLVGRAIFQQQHLLYQALLDWLISFKTEFAEEA